MSTEQTTSFSSSGEDAITRTIDINDEIGPSTAGFEFREFYEIERTAQELVSGKYKRIALQFPDELLHDSVPIFRHLTQRTSELRRDSAARLALTTSSTDAAEEDREPEFYVLADTSYGSCCVDEVAAQHVNADALVHYGHACMTLTSRLPVIYVFGRQKLNIELCVGELLRVFDSSDTDDSSMSKKKAILLKHNVVFTHLADSVLKTLTEELNKRNPPIPVLYDEISVVSYPGIPPTSDKAKSVTSESAEEDGHLEQTTTIFYIGGESLSLTNLLMTNAACDVFTFDPRTETATLASGRTNRLLMRRYAAVQKARDADVFGILVGTLGVASYLPLISHLRRLLARRRKKSYTISVGKLNPAKLANFLEVECFVLVACPENSLVEGKDFLRPIVTPYELEVALQAEQSWTGSYVLDFGRLLSDAKDVADSTPAAPSRTSIENGDANTTPSDQEDDNNESDDDQPVFSLITGTYRHAKRYGGKTDANNDERLIQGTSALVLRNQDDQIARIDSAAGQFLQQRTYQGLEVRMGEDAPSILEQGRSGIPRGYQDDRVHQDI
ncbi:diphthamide biosynthesis protein [Pholiota conissans]|uniref:2-(3-amino-3-carboxypropyl)histidine synthase subunit 2 n=1 Tax=Pholiota conissans TaxID=109636 RepID=A0A9P5Z0W6_9AGAR|nr:diphthamide biosynthesis protein [Pholiota conissans]